MLLDVAFDLVGQVSTRTTDQTLDIAATRVMSAVQDAAQYATDASTSSFYSSVDGAVPFHAGGYRESKMPLQTKLNDAPIACADSESCATGLLR